MKSLAEVGCGERCSHIKNRGKWGAGPWQDEPDRLDFTAHGFNCLLHRGPGGNWCGYVGVEPGHPAHGLGYSHYDYSDKPQTLTPTQKAINAIEVHGGLTYAQGCNDHLCHVSAPGEPDALWWFGFDCAHSQDVSPAIEWTRSRDYSIGGVSQYRTMQYVKRETERLAKQLAEMKETQ